jgi:hypothetical protein
MNGSMLSAAILLALGICIAMPAAGAGDPPAPSMMKIRGGESFALANAPGTPLTIRFMHVISDDRCPSPVLCTWAAPPVVELELSEAGEPGLRVRLKPAGDLGSPARYHGWVVRLQDLLPYPRDPQHFGEVRDIRAYEAVVQAEREPAKLFN